MRNVAVPSTLIILSIADSHRNLYWVLKCHSQQRQNMCHCFHQSWACDNLYIMRQYQCNNKDGQQWGTVYALIVETAMRQRCKRQCNNRHILWPYNIVTLASAKLHLKKIIFDPQQSHRKATRKIHGKNSNNFKPCFSLFPTDINCV